MTDPDAYISDHPYKGDKDLDPLGSFCLHETDGVVCNEPSSWHADPRGHGPHLIERYPHEFVKPPEGGDHCAYACTTTGETDLRVAGTWRVCGYPEAEHHVRRAQLPVRMADIAQYMREPMPEAARRGIQVTLIDGPFDPLGTMAVIGGIYTGKVRRSKNEVTDDERKAMLDDMLATVLSGPLECIQFTFLIEGIDRAITHQLVRNRFAFVAQESLRFAVAEDWAQEIPLPPSLAGMAGDAPAVGIWRRALNQAEDNYAALVGAGMPAEEARGLLPHAITTRLYWTISLRTLLQEAGKRTCTQAQFPWRSLFAGVAKALRHRGHVAESEPVQNGRRDGWQYKAFADLIRPVCYQQGKCGFMAKFDRGCTIRARVDAFEREGVPSAVWHDREIFGPGAIDPREWAADPAAARVVE